MSLRKVKRVRNISTSSDEQCSSPVSKYQDDEQTFNVSQNNITMYMSVYQEDLSKSWYDINDGFESGESKMTSKSISNQYLCKNCTSLYKIARRRKLPARKLVNDGAPHLWNTKYWMMIHRMPSRKAKKRPKNLRNTLKKLRKLKCSSSNRFVTKCCRAHSFLRRNLRLCKLAGRGFSKRKRKQKKKHISASKKHRSKNIEPSSSDNEEKDSCPVVKRFVSGVKCSWRQLSPVLTENNVEQSHNAAKQWESNFSDHTSDMITSIFSESDNPESDRPKECDQPSLLEPLKFSSDEDDTSPSTSSLCIKSGSFKEMLSNLKRGYLRSAIVKENTL